MGTLLTFTGETIAISKALQSFYRSRQISFNEESFLSSAARLDKAATIFIAELCVSLDDALEAEQGLNLFEKFGEAGTITHDYFFHGIYYQWNFFTYALKNDFLEELWEFVYEANRYTDNEFPSISTEKKLRNLSRELPWDLVKKYGFNEDHELINYFETQSIKSFLKELTTLLKAKTTRPTELN